MSKTQFGSSREDLAARSTVYTSGLFAGKTVVVTGAGSGLGLAICRGMLGAHAGQIHASPGPDNVGTRITMTLPLSAPSKDAENEH